MFEDLVNQGNVQAQECDLKRMKTEKSTIAGQKTFVPRKDVATTGLQAVVKTASSNTPGRPVVFNKLVSELVVLPHLQMIRNLVLNKLLRRIYHY